jgi:hypothetical protein
MTSGCHKVGREIAQFLDALAVDDAFVGSVCTGPLRHFLLAMI